MADFAAASIVFGSLVYVILFVDYYIRNIAMPGMIIIWIIIITLLLVAVSAMAVFAKYHNYSYILYNDRIEFQERALKSILYKNIIDVRPSWNKFDYWFRTVTMVIILNDGRKVSIKNLPDNNQFLFLFQKLRKQEGI
jgi:hypothetical protein